MYGCAVNFKAPKSGEVVLYRRFYDSLNNSVSDPYFTKNDTIFFFDSLVVFKVKILCDISDIFQNQTYEYKLCKYTFLDLRTMIYYVSPLPTPCFSTKNCTAPLLVWKIQI
jgi:hypothetical protein